jgi:hypothetical protein
MKKNIRKIRHSKEHNIKMDLKGTEWEGVNWIHLAQGIDQWFHKMLGNFLTG